MNISQTGATLSGSYSVTEGTVAEVGFEYGTDSQSLDKSVPYTGSSTDFSQELSGLTAGTLYYYRTYVKVQGTGELESTDKTFRGDVKRFNSGICRRIG